MIKPKDQEELERLDITYTWKYIGVTLQKVRRWLVGRILRRMRLNSEGTDKTTVKRDQLMTRVPFGDIVPTASLLCTFATSRFVEAVEDTIGANVPTGNALKDASNRILAGGDVDYLNSFFISLA